MMNTISEKQATQLKVLAKKSVTSENIFTTLALRDRMRDSTDLGRFKIQLIKECGNIVDNDYLGTFQELERIGMGAIIYGRKKKPTKFMWKYSLKEVGQSGIEAAKKEEVKKSVPVLTPTEHGINLNLRIGKAEVQMDFKNNQQALEFLKDFATA
jgi:predicted ABC-class ATPase